MASSAKLLGLCLSATQKLQLLIGRCHLSRINKKGKGCKIKGHGTIIGADNITLGDSVRIGEGFFIVATGGLTIGSYSIISRNCVIETQSHKYEGDMIPYGKEMVYGAVTIGEGVWIGMNVTILPGVKIGNGAIIGIGSVVAKDVDDYAICVGNPAVVKKYRDETRFQALLEQRRFRYPV